MSSFNNSLRLDFRFLVQEQRNVIINFYGMDWPHALRIEVECFMIHASEMFYYIGPQKYDLKVVFYNFFIVSPKTQYEGYFCSIFNWFYE